MIYSNSSRNESSSNLQRKHLTFSITRITEISNHFSSSMFLNRRKRNLEFNDFKVHSLMLYLDLTLLIDHEERLTFLQFDWWSFSSRIITANWLTNSLNYTTGWINSPSDWHRDANPHRAILFGGCSLLRLKCLCRRIGSSFSRWTDTEMWRIHPFWREFIEYPFN